MSAVTRVVEPAVDAGSPSHVRGLHRHRLRLRELGLPDPPGPRSPRSRPLRTRPAAARDRRRIADRAAAVRGDRRARRVPAAPSPRWRSPAAWPVIVPASAIWSASSWCCRTVRLRLRPGCLGCGDERPGRPGRASPRSGDHAALPRRLQRRHGGRRPDGCRDGRARRTGHRPSRGDRRADRGGRVRSPSAASCPTPPRRPPTTSRGRVPAPGARRLARAADPAGRGLRPGVRLRRRHRQRLGQHRVDRRLRHLARPSARSASPSSWPP